MPKFAFCLDAFPEPQFWDQCALLQEIGYQGVEVSLPSLIGGKMKGITAENLLSFARQRAQELRGCAESRGISVTALSCPCSRADLAVIEEQARRSTAAFLVQAGEVCRLLNTERLVLGRPGRRPFLLHPNAQPVSAERSVSNACLTLRLAAPGFAKTGVRFCFGPTSPAENEYLDRHEQAATLLRGVGHENCTLLLDTGVLSNETRSEEAIIAALAPMIDYVHAASPDGKKFDDLNLVDILRALNRAQYDGWISVHAEAQEEEPDTVARYCFEFLELCLEEVGDPV